MTVTSGQATAGTARGRAPAPRKARRRLNSGDGRRGLLLVAPTLIMLAVVIGYPIVKAVFMSFQKDEGLNAAGMFVPGGNAGFSNYTHWLLQQCTSTVSSGTVACPPGNIASGFYNAVWVTVLFTVITVVIEVTLGMWFATIMNKSFRGRGLLRASVLIPWAIPTAVTAKLWLFIFNYAGIMNSVLHTHILWTGDKWPSRFAVIIADVWKTTPFMALLILAGLQIISAEVYEAAKVDGASAWQRFVHITLPLVRPALMVAVLFRTLDVLRMFDLPYILTGGGGGSGDATTTLSILVVDQIRQGFNSAAALSTLTFLLIFAIAFFFVRFLGANVVQTQESQRKAR
ncbi:MAG: carbohydrate ABC transporter permease [Nocardioidaceae bacterium]